MLVHFSDDVDDAGDVIPLREDSPPSTAANAAATLEPSEGGYAGLLDPNAFSDPAILL
jgi:hypothetical protein